MHHHGDPDPTWMIPGMLAIFPVWWFFINYFISRFGWTGFAERYPAGDPPPVGAVTFRRCNGKIGRWARYNSCLKVTPLGRGIHVVPRWMFRLFHPPLLLPWEGVRSVTEKRLLFIRRIVVQFEDQEQRKLTLTLPGDALAAIREASGRRDLNPSAREGWRGGWS